MARRWILVAGIVLGACSTFSESSDAPTATENDGGTPEAAADAADAQTGDGAVPCSDTGCVEVLATGQANAGEVMLDDQRVFWTIDDDSGMIRVRELADGSQPYDLLSNSSTRPRSLSKYGDFLYFASDVNGRHILRDTKGGGSTLTVTSPAAAITSIVRVGQKVFVTSGKYAYVCLLAQGSNSCPGNTFSSAFDVGAGARSLAVDANTERVWLATDVSVSRSDVATPTFLSWWPLTKVLALAADETAVYIARADEKGITKFKRDDAIDAVPTILAPGAPPPYALAIEGGDVFYTAIDAGVVMKISKDGSSVKAIASGLARPKGIAVRLDKVYVALGDGRIVALPRN